MTAGHSDLVRFESNTSDRFSAVKRELTKMVQQARINVRKRTSGQNLLSQKFLTQVRQALEGVDMRQRFRAKVGQRETSSWLTSDPLYQAWLSTAQSSKTQRSYMWLKGGPGLGKTNASLAAVQKISQAQLQEQQMDTVHGRNETFLAYFLCERSSGCSTAEDLLKSLITQLINQEESLAQHARWFVPNPRYRGPTENESPESTVSSGAKATATVDNLFQCLQDMIDDPVVSSVHLVISNMHCLESSDSTNALLAKLRYDAESAPLAPRRARWLITSRNDKHIRQYLAVKCVSVIDLENDREYGNKVKVARQKHAKDTVAQLRANKKYSSDLAYHVRNFIESQSEDEKWIDVLCILLGAMPADTSNLSVRKWLKETGTYSIDKLVKHAWNTVCPSACIV